jgi:hypothetical protein
MTAMRDFGMTSETSQKAISLTVLEESDDAFVDGEERISDFDDDIVSHETDNLDNVLGGLLSVDGLEFTDHLALDSTDIREATLDLVIRIEENASVRDFADAIRDVSILVEDGYLCFSVFAILCFADVLHAFSHSITFHEKVSS